MDSPALYYKANQQALCDDAWKAAVYLRHYAALKNWPRLDGIADLLLAAREVIEASELTS